MATQKKETVELPIWDKRMFELLDHAVFKKLADNQKDFLLQIEFVHFNNIKQVREGKQSFTHEHFRNASIKFDVNMDWFYGFTDIMARTKKKPDPLQMLKDAIMILEKKVDK